jgi:hypothetical protein
MSKYIRELQSEYIYGVQYTFTVYPKAVSELVSWVRGQPDGELQLDLCNSVPGMAGWHLFGSAVIHVSGGEIVEDSVNFTGKFWDLGNLTLYLAWYVNQYKEIGTVYVRYPVLRAYISDDQGNRLSGVEVKATPSVSYWDSYYGLTDVNGVAVIDIVNGGEPLNVYARKAEYDSYPDWTYLGQTPAPWVKGGDVEISGVLHYTGVQPPPPTYITVTVRVFHSITKQPIKGANVTLDSTSKVTDENGLAVFMNVQGGRDASIVVKCPGYRDYSAKVSLPLSDVEIGVGLTPSITVELKLAVDKTTIIEGEEVTFTGTLRVNGQPSTETVELVEVLPEGKYSSISKFSGDFIYKYKPSKGIHTYATNTVIYNTQYWSNIVKVDVREAGAPPPTAITITVVVRDANTHQPIQDANVSIDSYSKPTDSNGVAEIILPSPGTYTLTVSKSGYRTATWKFNFTGSTKITVDLISERALPTGNVNVYIHVYDALTHEPIEGAIVKLNGASTTTGSDGTASFMNIASGRYSLRVEKSWYIPQSMTIDVPERSIDVDVKMIGGLKQGILAGAAATLIIALASRPREKPIVIVTPPAK